MQNLKTLAYNELLGPDDPEFLEPQELSEQQEAVVNSLDKSTVYALMAVGQRISPTPKLPTVWKWCGF
ncbi:MAG: hypothetical protein AAGD06_04035 [Acidobacteriota bacterium]